MYYSAIFPRHDLERPEARRFAAEFKRRFPNQSGLQSPAFAFDAALTIGRAALAVGSDRSRVRTYIEALGNGRPALRGVTGDIAFDRNHDVPNGFVHMTRIRP
jgi:ABC-type branched-subunit amino acid transport system substrate-binding protein